MAIYIGEEKIKNICINNNFQQNISIGDKKLINYNSANSFDDLYNNVISVENIEELTQDNGEFFNFNSFNYKLPASTALRVKVKKDKERAYLKTKYSCDEIVLFFSRIIPDIFSYEVNIRFKEFESGKTKYRVGLERNVDNPSRFGINIYNQENILIQSFADSHTNTDAYTIIGIKRNGKDNELYIESKYMGTISGLIIKNEQNYPIPLYIEIEFINKSINASSYVVAPYFWIFNYTQTKDLNLKNE